MTPRSGKIRLGLYMFTPMIGGAEMYLKHLLWQLDRERYDVTLFCEPWPEFIDFLQAAECPGVRVCPVNIVESTGHVRARAGASGEPSASAGAPGFVSRLRGVHRRLPFAFLKAPGRLAATFTRWALVPLNFVRLRAAFRKYPVDVLHITNGGYPGAQTALLAATAARAAGCASCIMTVCNMPMPVRVPKMLERLLDRLVHRDVDRIVVPSDIIGRQMAEIRGFSPSRVEKIYFGTVDPDAKARPPVAQNGRVSLGMVASFLSHKGHRFAIEGLAQLAAEFPQLSLTLIGGGPTKGAMEVLARDRRVASQVRFPGFRTLDETIDEMRRFDILIHPSEMEAMPYVILYAMGLGKPVIASDVGGIPDLIAEGETGLMVPPADAPALAGAIRSLLVDKRRSAEMGRAARRRFERYFTVEQMVARHQDLYDSLWAGGLRAAV